jgi:hypothetical protein
MIKRDLGLLKWKARRMYSSIIPPFKGEGFKSLKEGDEVEFETPKGPKGPNATNLRILR